MFRLCTVLLIGLVAAASAASFGRINIGKPGSDQGGRIAGGAVAAPGQFPYQVALLTGASGDIHFCGGSIINRRWIVTAGTCTAGKSTGDIVVLAGVNRLQAGGGQRHAVDRIVQHPNFDVELYANDVAVLRVVAPFVFSDYVQAVPLRGAVVEAGLTATASGFGRESISGAAGDALRFIEVELIAQDECRVAFDEDYAPRLADNTVCSSTPEGRGVCLGDAGGPLVNDGELIGVISWSVPCGLGMPDVYARISAHRAWIQVHTLI